MSNLEGRKKKLSYLAVEGDECPVKIKVVGVGGAGGNAVNRMIEYGIANVEFVAANTDLQDLRNSKADNTIHLGKEITRGLGCGAQADLGAKSATECTDQIAEILGGTEMVFVTAGMGGGTGTGAAPIIASIARELGALTVAVVTTPFAFEGKKRVARAFEGLQELRQAVDSIIVVPNFKLIEIAGSDLNVSDAFSMADDVLRQGIQGISELVTQQGVINLDFADVCSVLKDSGLCLMGIGEADGQSRASEAMQKALKSPLLSDYSIQGATRAIINVHGSHDVKLSEFDEAGNILKDFCDGNAEIFAGLIDSKTASQGSPGDGLRITLLVTGLANQQMDFMFPQGLMMNTAPPDDIPKIPTQGDDFDIELIRQKQANAQKASEKLSSVPTFIRRNGTTP